MKTNSSDSAPSLDKSDSGQATRYDFWVLLTLNMLVGLAFVLYFFSYAFLSGHSALFLSPQGDFETYVTGGNFFINEAWHFPIFKTYMIERSVPQSLAFSDLIPLFAIVAKVLKQLSGYQFAYFAWWYAAVVFLQPVSFTALLWAAGIRNQLVLMVGGTLSILVPAFLFRVGHSALFGHFAFIISLALYFFTIRQKKEETAWRASLIIAWPAWLCAAATISMYHLVFSIILFACALLQSILDSRGRFFGANFAAALAIGIGSAAILVVTLYSLGFFVPYRGGGALGIASMNILSTWVPQRSSLFPNSIPIIDATGVQYEGYNYLGAGILLLLFVALLLARRDDLNSIKRHSILLTAMTLMTIFAISNKAYVGHYLLWSIDAPDFLGSFRNSGRFIWPITYLLIVASFISISKLSALRMTILLVLVIGLQWADMRFLSDGLWDLGHSLYPQPRLDDEQGLLALIKRYPAIHVEPDYACVDSTVNQYIEDLSWYASRSNRRVNVVYQARSPMDWNCEVEPKEVVDAERKGYLTFSFYQTKVAPTRDRSGCAERQGILICMSANNRMFDSATVSRLFSPSSRDADQEGRSR